MAKDTPEIVALRERVEALETELLAAKGALHEARVKASGITVGAIVRVKRRGIAGLYRVSRIEPGHFMGTYGNPTVKSGGFGRSERYLGFVDDLEIVTPTP